MTQPVLFSEVILASLNELLFLLWIVTLTSYATLQAVVEPPAEKKRTSQRGFVSFILYIPVVPHKAVAEVSKIGNIGESGMAERIH